eukprot:3046838-Pyramimonas_sp.AAC.1
MSRQHFCITCPRLLVFRIAQGLGTSPGEFPNHPVMLGPRFEETVPRAPLLYSSSPSSLPSACVPHIQYS